MNKIIMFLSLIVQLVITTSIELLGNERGEVYVSGQGMIISIDGNEAELTNVDEAFGEVLSTWFELGSAVAKNKVTGIDPEFTLSIRLDTDSLAHQALLAMRYSEDRTVPIIITDNHLGATGSTITFSGEIVSIGDTRTTETVVEMDATLKVASGEIVVAPVV